MHPPVKISEVHAHYPILPCMRCLGTAGVLRSHTLSLLLQYIDSFQLVYCYSTRRFNCILRIGVPIGFRLRVLVVR
jgi:hypothetical protein